MSKPQSKSQVGITQDCYAVKKPYYAGSKRVLKKQLRRARRRDDRVIDPQ